MSLFSCFNPACCKGFSSRASVQNHRQKYDICAEDTSVTIMCPFSDESDLDTDSISPEVVEENINNIDNNDNFSIGIDDDDDDDNNSESKRQQIS